MLRFQRWRERHWPGVMADYPSTAYRILSWTRIPAVNMRTVRLWNVDPRRYTGEMYINGHGRSEGVELSFAATRHGARPRPSIVIAQHGVDTLILSLLQVRRGEWTELSAEEVGVPALADLEEKPDRHGGEGFTAYRASLLRASPRRALEGIRGMLDVIEDPLAQYPEHLRDATQEERVTWALVQIRSFASDALG